MALDEKIYQLRRDKLAQIEALGQQAYPHKFTFTQRHLRADVKHPNNTCTISV